MMEYGPDEDRNMTAETTRRGRKDDPALTQRLLEAMIHALAEAGFEAVRLDDIARVTGTSKQAIYRRWPDKKAFAVVSVEQALDRISVPVPERFNAARDLHRLVRGYLAALEGDTGNALLQVRPIPTFGTLIERFEGEVGFHIRQCLIATHFEPDLQARTTLIIGLVWQQIFALRSRNSGLQEGDLESAIYLVLGLLAPRDPAVSNNGPGL